jgi:iron only hydrogenase large subunit-like protein
VDILQFDKLHCKNCYKCVRHCPVKAIEVKNHRAQINAAECILCGECTIICPQKTKGAISEVAQLRETIAAGESVIASLAPSAVAYFHCSVESLQAALAKLKFAAAFETAEGAYLVKTEYEKLIAAQSGQVWISSCCSSVNLLIGKYYPAALPHLAPVATPIQAHAKLLKERFPTAKIAFITPCVSKKTERYAIDSLIDYVISFEELAELLREAGIVLTPDSDGDGQQYLSRKFPADGGIIATMARSAGQRYVSVSGYNACVQAIRDIQDGRITDCFVEMSLCEGSCIGGPSFRRQELSLLGASLEIQRHSAAANYAADFNLSCQSSLTRRFAPQPASAAPSPSAEQVAAVLRKMGKLSPADELNCGMCGYHSCREKAAAILAGKAEINMCLPYMSERPSRFPTRLSTSRPTRLSRWIWT